MQAFFSFAGRHANKSQYLTRTISLGTFLLLLFSCTVILLTRIAKADVTSWGAYGKQLGAGLQFSERLQQVSRYFVDYTASAVAANALESGPVNKSGPVPLQYWDARQAQARTAKFSAWESETARDPNGTLAASWKKGVRLPNLLPLFPYCMLYVNHRYKIIYVRQPKSASTSTLHFFMTCKKVHQNVTGMLGVGAACLERLDGFSSPEAAHAMWSDYLVFSVVRNPYSRLVSAYKFLLSMTRGDQGCPTVRWDAFCADPLSLGRACKQHLHCCPLRAGFAWHHVIDQGRCVVTEEGAWAVDFVVTVERLAEQMDALLTEIDRRRDPGLPSIRSVTVPLAGPRQKRKGCTHNSLGRSSELGTAPIPTVTPEERTVLGHRFNATVLLDHYCSSADYYRGDHAHCLDQARHFYHTDFQRLYPPHQQD